MKKFLAISFEKCKFAGVRYIEKFSFGLEKLLKSVILQMKEKVDETEYIMSSPAMVEILRKGDEDIKEGKGRVVKLDELWK